MNISVSNSTYSTEKSAGMAAAFRRCLLVALAFSATNALMLPSLPTPAHHMVHPARSPPAVCAEPKYLFEVDRNAGHIRFGCQQRSITMVRPEAGGSLEEFICSDPESIVMSSWGAGRVTPTGSPGEFIINLEEFDFVSLRIAVELTVAVELSGTTAKLVSRGFRLIGPGLDAIGERINIQVQGAMRPSPPSSALCSLTGDVRFEASGELPALLAPIPEGALRAAANAVSLSRPCLSCCAHSCRRRHCWCHCWCRCCRNSPSMLSRHATPPPLPGPSRAAHRLHPILCHLSPP